MGWAMEIQKVPSIYNLLRRSLRWTTIKLKAKEVLVINNLALGSLWGWVGARGEYTIEETFGKLR